MRSLQNQVLFFRRLQWTLGVAVLIGGAAFFLLNYRKAVGRLASLRMEIEARQRDLSQNQDKARNLSILAAEVQKLESQVAAYDRQFPKQPELGPFIRDLTQISQQLSLAEWKYQPGAPKRGESFYELPIQMHFEGDFINVASFLRQIEDMQRLTRVNKVTIKAKDAKAGVVEAEVTMNIYFSEG